MSPAKISVAMCTYHGERFLAQQLASIAKQTRPPDELVVCDDRSSDRTVEILRDFAASVSHPVKIFENETNLGFVANFERAIQLCTGDLIALSDQDDIWYPERLELSEREFAAHPEVGLVFSDADLIDDQDQLTAGLKIDQARDQPDLFGRQFGRRANGIDLFHHLCSLVATDSRIGCDHTAEAFVALRWYHLRSGQPRNGDRADIWARAPESNHRRRWCGYILPHCNGGRGYVGSPRT